MSTTAETSMASTNGTEPTLLNERDWTGRIYSGGWVDAPGTIETIEPATGTVLGNAGVGDAASITQGMRGRRRRSRPGRQWP